MFPHHVTNLNHTYVLSLWRDSPDRGEGLPGDEGTSPIIHGSLTNIPTVDVPTHNHHLVHIIIVPL